MSNPINLGPRPGDDKRLAKAREAFRAADKAAFDALCAAMYRGRKVSWVRRGHRQTGTVIGIFGHCFHHAAVKVINSRTAKFSSVSIENITGER